MAEEEFHEIQLNGKQLVFLFMAGTVAAVVIFLCGLMVGRNLRVPRLEAAAATTEVAAADPTSTEAELPPPAASSESTKPPTIDETLTYNAHLEAPKTVDEPLMRDQPASRSTKAIEPKPLDSVRTVAPEKPSAVAAKTAPASERDKTPAAAAPTGNGWTVQVQAVNSKQEAETIARRLSAKGFPAFVTPRGSGTLVKYGVRVGNYPKKQDAEAMKARLEREEQFKPWVTR